MGGGNSKTLYSPQSEKSRVDYVDLMKGLTIIWIIWIHAGSFDIGNYRNPVFFFASGIFFKISDAKTFFTKRLWMIIIPFCFFYVASVPFRYVVDLWDYRDFGAFDWNRILDIFKVKAIHDYLSLNVPLWFLMTLFWIQVYSFILFHLPRWTILTLAILSIVFKDFLSEDIATPFLINNAMAWFGFFAFGYLAGKPLIAFLNSNKKKIFVFISTSLIVTAFIIIEQLEIPDWHSLRENTKLLVFVIGFMTFFSFFNGWSKLQILRYFGKNSLIILGSHLWILIPLKRITFMLNREITPWSGLVCSVICAVLLIPLINLMNKYIPDLVGKKKIDNRNREFIKESY